MDFGKVSTEQLAKINFQFPDFEGFMLPLAKTTPNPTLLKVRVGCPVWANKSWVGKIYPKGTKEKDFLKNYSQQFSTIELNTTHYRTPDVATIQHWKKITTENFVFCPKFLQNISHKLILEQNFEVQTQYFCENILQLEDKLGYCFLQMPPYFEVKKLPLLDKFLTFLPPNFPLAVELRHESWFEPNALAEVVSLLHQHQKAMVITDVAGRRDVLHLQLTNHVAMIRFVGNNLHPTDYQRIDAWVERLKLWHTEGLQEVYFFAHEPNNDLAPEIADYFIQRANEVLSCQVNTLQWHTKNLTERLRQIPIF